MKAHITDLMLSAPPRVRAQLSEALSIISSHDFPAKWPSLLPHLVDKMGGSGDPQVGCEVAGELQHGPGWQQLPQAPLQPPALSTGTCTPDVRLLVCLAPCSWSMVC